VAGALGFILGAGLGAAKQKAQKEFSTKSQLAQIAIQEGIKSGDPEFFSSPDVQKIIKPIYGNDAAPMLMSLSGMIQKRHQQFAQDVNGGGQQPQGGMPQQGGAPASPLDQYDAQIKRLSAIRDSGKYQDPQQIKFLDDHIKELEHERDKTQSQLNFQQTQARLDQAHQDSENDRQTFHADAQANAAATRAIAASNAETSNELKRLEAGLAVDRAKEQKQKDFDTAKGSLQKQFQTIVAAQQGSTTRPAMNAKQLQPMVDRYNAQAKALAARGKKLGVDYDPDELQPLKADDVTTHPWYKLGIPSTTTELGNADAGAGGGKRVTATLKNGQKITGTLNPDGSITPD